MADSVTLRRSLRIEWKVKNFFSVNSLETQDFSFAISRCKFVLTRIWPGETERFAIEMSRTNSSETVLNEIRIKMFIEDRNQRPLFSREKTTDQTKHLLWCEYASDLRKGVGTFLADGVVTFVFELTTVTTSEDKLERDISAKIAVNLESLANLERLSLDFHHLLDDSLLSDVTLKCRDRSLPVHRNILCARSEVFLAMLRSDMTESRTGIIEISDMEPSTLGQLVQYIYSGEVSDLSADSAQQLYAAADKYAIDSLKKLCWNFMKENLTEENACHFLALADLHGDKDMKDKVLSFIMERELLQDKDRWIKFLNEHSEMAAEVMHHVYKAKCTPK